MPGAWWSKSDAKFGALRRVNDADVAALLERAARALDNDGNRIDAGAEPRALWQWQCFRALRPPPTQRRDFPKCLVKNKLNLLRWPHERLVERAVLRR